MIKAAESAKEPLYDPPSYYKPQPNIQGMLVWLLGGPGAGKSTTAKLLSEKHNFVYYEGDCFLFRYNPFVGKCPAGPGYFGNTKLKGISTKLAKAMQQFREYNQNRRAENRNIDP